MPKLKIDLHVHTDYSDSTSSVELVLEAARKRNLDGIAITDHETTAGYIHASKMAANLIIIPGVEIETDSGHILVLGINNPPSKCLSVANAIDYSRKEGAVIIIPHPSLPFIGVKEEVIRHIKPDAIETHNSKAPFFRYFVGQNTRLANSLGLPKTGGSDAHSHNSVGDAYTIVDADSRSVEAVLESIRRGRTQPEGEASSLKENLMTMRAFMRNIYQGLST